MQKPVSITLHYFAMLREQRGVASETLQTSARTAADLYAELAAQYCFTMPANDIAVAVNERICKADHVLQHGDRVAFIPPVAGG